ncbi:unnamed protein product [Lactuca saligna]|uniref:RPW8 domain-containing protein n=1 Tax=Lactuca saligna TaxID=75948 RepID=A0AA36EQ88_LACSI|nr:unnamed protein product [Lactuca saligna]
MAFLKDPDISQSISTLANLAISVAQTTANFKPELKLLVVTLERIAPIIQDTINMNQKLDRPEAEWKMLRDEMQRAIKLVKKCSKVKWNIIKKSAYRQKLKDINGNFLRFFEFEVQALQSRNIRETLLEVNNVKLKMDSLPSDLTKDTRLRTGEVGNRSGSLSSSFITEQSRCENMEREKYGWRVPALPSGIVPFDELLEKLKAEVVAGIDGGGDGSSMDYEYLSVLVVAAPGGCGKTTLVKMLCHDPGIEEKFGENIFFVTVSETPNMMVIVNDLFNPNSSGPQFLFQSNEDAKIQMESFLDEKVSGPMLLVLDDVWSDSFIDNFRSKNRGCKIVVTSRTAFPNYDVFQLDPLNEKDANTLFCHSAFSESEWRPSPTINDELVNQMVTCCKKHPLTLSVVGRSLNGKDESVWESMLKSLSQERLVLDLHKDVLMGLERSFEALDDEFKECFLDLGIFPEDERIPISSLLNMWVELYNHDDDGVDTLAKIFDLNHRDLVNLMATGFGNDLGATVTFCDQQFVTQHDLLRELAIHLNSKLPLPQRSRLIINARGEDLPVPASIEQLQEPMQARMLSISTGESFSSQWWNMKVPHVEVLVLNFMSNTYTLPRFLAGMPKLKILNLSNHGLYPTEIENFHLLSCSYNLTRIRLERVAISSSILPLLNLQKASFIMCKIGNAFEKVSTNTLPGLLELEIDSCQDLVEFPGTLCTTVRLKKLSITNCIQMSGFPEEFGNLTNLETLSLGSCMKLEKLPESISGLQKLRILDISDCLKLSKLPDEIGKLGGLRVIYMTGCTGLPPDQLPPSVKDLSHTHVVCNEQISYQWREFRNLEIHLVEED